MNGCVAVPYDSREPFSRGELIVANDHAVMVAGEAAAAIREKKGDDVALLDVSELVVVTDVFLIASGTSNRHVRTLVDEVEERLKTFGDRPLRREGVAYGRWVLLDYGDLVVHVFDAETREYYELERLWADAPRLPVPEHSVQTEA